MTTAMKSLSHDAMRLSPDERLQLACSLIESVESEDAPSPGAAWEEEIRGRIERYDNGETSGIPASEVFRELREIAPAK